MQGAVSIANPENVSHEQKLRPLSDEFESSLTHMLHRVDGSD